MSEKNPIEFAEASQKFLCEEYYMHNFGAFLHANGIEVESPEPFEPGGVTTTKELFSLEVKKESKPVTQERANTLIATFLAADAESKKNSSA
ncbi:MAG TPA: hypothetical protein VIS71_07585 [Terrimicrobium sp.]